MDLHRMQALSVCQREIELLKGELAQAKWKNSELMRENAKLKAQNAELTAIQDDSKDFELQSAEMVQLTAMREEEHETGDCIIEAETSRSARHISMCALSLHWLVNVFLVERPEVRATPLTTSQVTFDIIRPAVAERGCRYVDLIDDRESRDVISRGRSFFFISHSWGRPFIELVGQIIEHFKPENQAIWRPKGSPALKWEEIYVWLDIFAINQNPGVSQGDDLAQLQEVVEDAEQTLMILDNAGTILTRIWCLFEAWHSGKKKSKDALRLLSYGLKWQQLEKVFNDLDVSKAQATVKADLDMILSYIASDVGLLTMTHQLKDALVDSVVSAIPPDDEDHPWTTELSSRIFSGARVSYLYGRYEEAEPLYRRDLKGCERVLGEDHPSTLSKVNSLARLLQAQGKLSEAEPLFVRAMEVKKRVLGSSDPETLLSINNLGILYQSLGKLTEAETLLSSALEGRMEIMGPDHPDTLSSISLLGDLFRIQGQHERGEEYQRKAVEGREAALGLEHPDTLKAVHRLALVLIERGMGEVALPYCLRAVEVRTKVLGAEHKDVVESRKLLEALKHSREGLE